MDTTYILDTGNTAWIIVATILVLLMTIPGIALFYGGLVRQKNVLSIVMQSLLIVAAVSVLWILFGYSFVFGTGLMDAGSPLGAVIGGFDKVCLSGITTGTLTTGRIPELLFVLFQCMFAIITPALILGAFAERVKFSGFLLFTLLWSVLVYIPMAHWVWGGGFLQQMGAIDFAGGTVVHINAGISALMMALLVGRRTQVWLLLGGLRRAATPVALHARHHPTAGRQAWLHPGCTPSYAAGRFLRVYADGALPAPSPTLPARTAGRHVGLVQHPGCEGAQQLHDLCVPEKTEKLSGGGSYGKE